MCVIVNVMSEFIQQLDLGEENKSTKKYMRGAEPFFDLKSSEIGVLLLHGFSASPYQFRYLRDLLTKKNITVYAPVIAGHGTHPDDLSKTTIEDWMTSIENAYNELKAKVKKIVIIGNSFGANLGFQLAIKNDESLKGIVSLGAPIHLRWHRNIICRAYSYGWLKKNYKKRKKNYASNLMDEVSVEVSYPVIPLKSLRNFLKFIKYFTLPGLKHIATPALIIQANQDPVVHSKSVQHLHQHLGSEYKKVCWLDGRFHSMPDIYKKEEIFDIIYSFIQEVSNGNIKKI